MPPRNRFVFALAAALLSGCLSPRTDRTQYYLLSSQPPGPAPARVQPDKVFFIGVRMTSSEFLRAEQMLVQEGPNQMRISEENLWEETPQAGFKRILFERWAWNMPDCQVVPLPSDGSNKPELVLEIELRSLQGRLNPSPAAEVSAEVRILDSNSHLLEREVLRDTSPWHPSAGREAYAALAAAESRAATDLADAIGQKVWRLHREHSVH